MRGLFLSGPVCQAVGALRQEAPNTAHLVEQAAVWLDRDLGARATELDRLARKKNDAPLVGGALEWLRGTLADLATKLRRWLAVQRRASSARPSHHSDTRTIVRDLLDQALSDVVKLEGEDDLSGACAACARSLKAVQSTLNGETEPPETARLDLDMIQHDDLLAFDPYPARARRGDWDADTALHFIDLAEAQLNQQPDFDAAVSRLLDQGRFAQARQAAARLDLHGRPDAMFEKRIEDAQIAMLETLRTEVKRLRASADDVLGADTENKVDPAPAFHVDTLSASLVSGPGIFESEYQLADRLDFPTLRDSIGARREEIRLWMEQLLVPLQQQIDQLEQAGRKVDDLRELASKQDLTSLRDNLAGQGASEADQHEDQQSLLRDFGRGFASQIFHSRPLRERSVDRALDDLRSGQRGPAMDFSLLTEADRGLSERLLRAGQGLKVSRSSGSALREFLQEVRLAGVKIERVTPLDRARLFRVVLDRTTDRRDCPVPAFDSDANGKLNVIVADSQSHDGLELHRLVREVRDGLVPVLVIV